MITSNSDIKEGKIWNRHVFVFLLLGFILLLMVYFLGIIKQHVLIESITNFLFALILGYFLWVIKIWSAGDGKLFTTYALLFPISVYVLPNRIGFFNFSSIQILINTFIIGFVFLFFNMLLKSSYKQKLVAIKSSISFNVLSYTALAIFSYTWILRLLFEVIGLTPNIVFSYMVILILFIVTDKTKFSMKSLLILVVVLRLIFDRSWYSFDFLIDFVLLVALFVIVRYFTLELGFTTFTKEVEIKDLKTGMILADMIYEENKKIVKKKGLSFSVMSYLIPKDSMFNGTEGLTKEDISNLKNLKKTNKDLERVRIHEHMPFAILMFIGIFLTYLVRGNIFNYLLNLI